MAMILDDWSIPARCWMAPEMPAAMYRRGRTVVPVWPTWDSRPISPRVDRRARGADLATEQVGELAQQGELVGVRDAGSAGHDDRGVLELDRGRGGPARLRTSRAKSAGSNSGVTGSTTPVRSAIGDRHAHHALADRRHLGPGVRIDDRGDEVAAEGRPDLVQQVLVRPVLALDVVVADLEIRAVGGEPAAQGARDARREVAAVGRAADEEDLRLPPAGLGDRDPGVRQGAVLGQLGMIRQQDAVGAVADDVARPVASTPCPHRRPTTS